MGHLFDNCVPPVPRQRAKCKEAVFLSYIVCLVWSVQELMESMGYHRHGNNALIGCQREQHFSLAFEALFFDSFPAGELCFCIFITFGMK